LDFLGSEGVLSFSTGGVALVDFGTAPLELGTGGGGFLTSTGWVLTGVGLKVGCTG
jgi:hypothetical protein